jgi:hypothetical protein
LHAGTLRQQPAGFRQFAGGFLQPVSLGQQQS